MARHTGNRWTNYSTATLVDMAAAGYTRSEIATRLQRTPIAIKRKMHSLKYHFVRNLNFGQFANIVLNSNE